LCGLRRGRHRADSLNLPAATDTPVLSQKAAPIVATNTRADPGCQPKEIQGTADNWF
jgi:hypothetical protein